jgi:hypothetical protein
MALSGQHPADATSRCRACECQAPARGEWPADAGPADAEPADARHVSAAGFGGPAGETRLSSEADSAVAFSKLQPCRRPQSATWGLHPRTPGRDGARMPIGRGLRELKRLLAESIAMAEIPESRNIEKIQLGTRRGFGVGPDPESHRKNSRW